jgi:hypothetical protein
MLFISTPTRDFDRGTYSTLLYPQNKDVLVSGATLERNKTKSRAVAMQSHWFDNTLVSTLGWRNDQFKNYDAGQAPQDFRGSRQVGSDVFRLPGSPDIDTEGNTFSWGLVAHAPTRIRDNLPAGMDVSLHYGESENFAPSAVARSPYGGFFSPPSGTTEDYGATLSFLDNKIVARMTWYETIQENLFDNRLVGPYLWFFYQVPQQVYNNNPTADVLATNFELPVQPIQDAYRWNFLTNPDGSIAIDGEAIGAGDIIQAVSEGFEMDITANMSPNWRLSLNAAQQEAVRTGTAQTGLDEVNRLAAAWLGNTAQGDLLENNNNPVRGRITQQLALVQNALANDGQKANELREWRVNLVTNYTFAKDSRLKGFGVGGAWRYQSRSAIGNELITDPDLGVVPDINRPFWGPDDAKVDAWVSYRSKIFNDIDWTLQLNIRNLFNEDDLIPTWYNPDGTGFVYSSAKERDWFLTSTFRF